jgi:serine/threonine-protein kinase
MTAHPLTDKEIGNYVIRALLGEGGMGAVFAGEHRFLGTRVAIKVLHGTYANNQAVTQRFFQEAKSSLEIGHPNIIKILDFGQTGDGQLYLVMELLEGASLAQTLARRGALGEGMAARIGMAIADGLVAAHHKGIVHRDLKPDNVFLTSGNEIKILDFGIAKVSKAVASTKTGSLLGTPQYMAPEQARGSQHVGPHTDIYALGAILFEMVTGRPPFSGEDLAELLTKHLFEEPLKPSLLTEVSPAMETLILQCLAKSPDERPATMIEVRSRLAALAGSADEPLAAPPAGASVERAAALSTLGGATGERRALSLADKPRRVPRAALVAGVLALLIGGTVAVTRRGPGAKAATAAVVAPPAPLPSSAPPQPPPPPPALAKVILRSEPPGATVTVDGKPAGTTPTLLSIALPQEVYLSLDSYQPAKEIVSAPGETVVKLVPEKKHEPVRPAAHRPPAKPKAAPAAKPGGEGLD